MLRGERMVKCESCGKETDNPKTIDDLSLCEDCYTEAYLEKQKLGGSCGGCYGCR
jgi:hypothetical protein